MERVLELIERSHHGDKEARDELVHNNLGLVWSIVKRFSNRGYDPEDLFQIGSIGLLKAIDHFDPAFDVKFSTYAVPLITGEIKRFLRDDGMLKVSRSLKENAWKISRASEQWQNAHGREATIEELAAQTHLTAEDVVLSLSAGAEVDSLYRSVPGTEGKELILQDQIRDEKNEMEKKINHIFLQQLLSGLSGDERKLIWLRYFQERTQADVAKILKTTQVQVSRMEKRLLAKMRNMSS